jgi:hypothetical protein
MEDPRGSTVVHGGATLLVVVRRSELTRTLQFLMRPGAG